MNELAAPIDDIVEGIARLNAVSLPSLADDDVVRLQQDCAQSIRRLEAAQLAL